MLAICDTHILLFGADRQDRLTVASQQALDSGRAEGNMPALQLVSGKSPYCFAKIDWCCRYNIHQPLITWKTSLIRLV